MAVERDVAFDAVRVVYRAEQLSPFDLNSRLSEFVDLVFVCSDIPKLTLGLPNSGATKVPKSRDEFEIIRSDLSVSLEIQRLSYNSPLEWIISIGSAGTILLGLASQWADVREKLARSSTTVRSQKLEREALKLVKEQFERSISSGSSDIFRVVATHRAEEIMRNAAKCLTESDSITAVDRRDTEVPTQP